jgi:hypothetical protein
LVYYGSGKAQNTALNAALDPRTTEIATGVSIPIYNNVAETRTSYFNYNLEAFLNYNRTFQEFHKVKATLGASVFADVNKSLTVQDIMYPITQMISQIYLQQMVPIY